MLNKKLTNSECFGSAYGGRRFSTAWSGKSINKMQIFILQSRPSIPIRVKMQNVFGQCQDVTLESQIETNIPIFHYFHLKISLCLNWDIFYHREFLGIFLIGQTVKIMKQNLKLYIRNDYFEVEYKLY